MLLSTHRKMLTLFYLFMNADGKCTKGELKKFEDICKEFEAEPEEKKDVIKFCEQFDFSKNDNSETIIPVIDDILTGKSERFNESYSYFEFLHKFLNIGELRDEEERNFVIWTMINLGYADNEYTPSERKIVDFLVSKWDIDSGIVSYMMDTADTMLALVNKKEWIRTLDESDEKKNKLIRKIKEDIEKIQENIKLTISEVI